MDKTAHSSSDIKTASQAALLSLLNLTLLPIIAFSALLWIYNKTQPGTIARYHAELGIKTNLFAAIALFLVSALMIAFGGFDSAWTWVYVISYFTIVHTTFIIFAVWALVRSWSGEKLNKLM